MDLASGQTSAKYFCWVTLIPPRTACLSLRRYNASYVRTVVHVTRSQMYAHAYGHRSCVSVGDKVAEISIYLRAKASPSLFSPHFSFRSASCRAKEGSAGCRLAPIAAINRRSFSRERIVERATMNPATSPGR